MGQGRRKGVNDPYTVSKRTARQAAEGLYKAFQNELRKTKAATSEADSLLAK